MRNLIAILLLALSQQGFSQQNNVVPFQPELFSQFPNVRDITMSADGAEMYFSAQSLLGETSTIIQVRKENGKWGEPTIASFSGKWKDLEPFLAPDGLRLYFVSERPLEAESAQAKDYDIWYAERKSKSAEWGTPKNIGSPINTEKNEFYPAITASGNLYFCTDGPESKGKDDLFVSEFKDGTYTKPVSLSTAVNSEGYEFNAYISPDESIMLYSCYARKDGFGSSDLYISKRNADGTWSDAKNLGEEINCNQRDFCPHYDAANGLLYFTSRRTNVRTDKHEFKSVEELKSELNQTVNGMSRIYVAEVGKL